MRYIIRQIGKLNPIFDKNDIEMITISHKARDLISYISHVDEVNAIVVNLTDACNAYVMDNGHGYINLTTI